MTNLYKEGYTDANDTICKEGYTSANETDPNDTIYKEGYTDANNTIAKLHEENDAAESRNHIKAVEQDFLQESLARLSQITINHAKSTGDQLEKSDARHAIKAVDDFFVQYDRQLDRKMDRMHATDDTTISYRNQKTSPRSKASLSFIRNQAPVNHEDLSPKTPRPGLK